MPKITLNKKDVLNLVGKHISDKELEEKIPLLGTDLEQISSDEIVVEIFPNRPDMLSEEGFARALSSFLGIKTGLRNYKVNKSDYKFKIDKKIEKVRPFAVAAIIKGIKFTEESLISIMNLQDKLHTSHGRNRKKVAMGIHDLDRIKFPLTYTTVPRDFVFQALEAPKPQSVKEILETHPKGAAYAHLLDKPKVPIWLDAEKQVLSMPPIINSEYTKVRPDTQDIFIDVTGLSQHAVEEALNILTVALADRGGEIYSVNNYPNLTPKKTKISVDKTNKLLGLNLTKEDIKKNLAKMGIDYNPAEATALWPAYRTDIMNQIDLIEDIIIAYGYDNLEPQIPDISTIAQEDPFENFKNKIAELCIGLGLEEVSNYHLSNKKDETTKMKTSLDCIKIINSLSQEYNVMRPWIIPSLLNVLKNNRHNEYPQNIFEIGKVFIKDKEEINEPSRLAITFCNSKSDYTQAKKALDAILLALGLKPEYSSAEHPSFIPGRVARVSVNNKKVAYIGEVSPEVITNFTLDTPVSAIELNLTDIYEILNN
jgi:phenylalanyl-tRNA synthetase beta chain